MTTQVGLERYAGRYQTDWKWQDGRDVYRFMDVKVEADHLAVAFEVVSTPVGAGFLPSDHRLVERRV